MIQICCFVLAERVDTFEALFRECEHLLYLQMVVLTTINLVMDSWICIYLPFIAIHYEAPKNSIFPQISFHFHAAHHGSDICDCIAAIDKREIRKYTLKCGKYIYKGEDLVTALEPLGGNFFSDWIVKGPDPIIRAKNEIQNQVISLF